MSTVTTNEEPHTDHELKPYLEVFIALAILTLIEVAIGETMETSALKVILLMTFALVKAGLVAAVFMHVWYDKDPKRIVIISFIVPLIGALILASSILADYR